MALPREISNDLFILCDALIEGGEEMMKTRTTAPTMIAALPFRDRRFQKSRIGRF